MRVIQHFIEPERACSYLPRPDARLEHKVMLEVSPNELARLLDRGWRHFGPVYFRPACTACAECVALRIPVDAFQPTPSQKRARRRCARFRIEVGRPAVDAERLALYAAWHADREATRDWEPSVLTAEDYFQQFAFPHPALMELSFHDGERLVAVGLMDVTPRAVSAIYFYFHPDIGRLSPGVANVMLCIELAKRAGIPHVHLGYRVQGCASLKYKGTFFPHELLQGRPGPDETPVWHRVYRPEEPPPPTPRPGPDQ